jgi:hypothetical protein
MKPARLLCALLLAATLSACGTALTKSETNPWLDLRAGSADYDISGKWDTAGSWGGNWGEANFIQDGARFFGQLGSYTVDGSVNGHHMYLTLSSGKKVYYTALLKREPDGNYAGKVAQNFIIDGPGADSAGYQVMILRRAKAATVPAPRPGEVEQRRAL